MVSGIFNSDKGINMISSTSNQQIKNIQNLMKKAKERKKQNVFIVEGPKLCFEAPHKLLKAVYVSESFYKENRYAKELNSVEAVTEVVSDQVFKTISDTQTPQGIMAIVQMPEYKLEDVINKEQPHILILESIQDPGNLGTMIRTGEGAGISGIIMNKTTVDIFNPKTVRATMGSLYRVPFFIAEDLTEAIAKLKENGIRLYAAHLKGKMSYDKPDYTKPCGFLIGNEGNGLSDEIADLADNYIKIPMAGKVESLNAAISATLLMYECSRQRRRGHEDLV